MAIVSVLAKITGQYQGVSSQGSYRFTRIWQQEADKWKIIVAHSSVLAE